METIGKILEENNWVDSEDKVAALEAAHNAAKENGLLVENPDTAYQRELQEARSAEEITPVNHKYFGTNLFQSVGSPEDGCHLVATGGFC